MRRAFLIIFFSSFLLLESCADDGFYQQSYELVNQQWSIEEQLNFEFDIEDNSQNNIISLTMRLNEDYPYANMYVFLKTDGPNQKERTDTLALLLAEADGKWKGTKSGSLIEFVIPIFNNKFPETGTYQLSLEHGMRDSNLPGVVDIGIKVD